MPLIHTLLVDLGVELVGPGVGYLSLVVGPGRLSSYMPRRLICLLRGLALMLPSSLA